MTLHESIANAASYLLKFQREDGHFEGELSANTFPTCAYTLFQMALGRPVDSDLIEWFIETQNDDGTWGLDASGGSDSEATLFVQLALKEIKTQVTDRDVCSTDHVEHAASLLRDKVEAALAKSSDLPLNLWIVKLMYARCGYISWEEVMPPGYLTAAMRLMEWLRPVLPKSLLSHLKPPVKFAPPVRLFYSSAFQDLFIAEKYTLVPLLLIMEAHTAKRKEVVAELTNWLLENRCADGSWFKVGLITAISLIALIDAKTFGYEVEHAASLFSNADLESAIREGDEWLQSLRTSDGGCREAVNLNIWDTALSVISFVGARGRVPLQSDEYRPQIDRAATWLLENQNEDGGWPFSGLPGGNLPSDADDTALATLALLKAGVSKDHIAVRRSVEWLKAHQSDDGGWGTYIPGTGDVSCVSVTSHVIEACLAMDELQNEIQRAIAWLKAVVSDSGYWRDLWLARNTYGTASAISALVKSGQADCAEVKSGIRWLTEVQNPDGGWGEDMEGHRGQSTIEQTAWSTYAVLLVEHAASLIKGDVRNASAQNKLAAYSTKGMEYLLSHQNPDGSWPSSCVGIYWEVIGGYIDPIYSSVFALMALSQAASL
jgi:squalene-hopene/tetraprenyl-beta-curcumene cyclase